MMATYGSISLMIMYEDESVDVRYGDNSRLQLSPCGSEFVLEKPHPVAPAAHTLQRVQRIRQRTRFAISSYKGLLQRALAFRNNYADRPYLPGELIPADRPYLPGELIPADRAYLPGELIPADRPYLPGELIPADRPYLPGELIPADLVQRPFTGDREGAWPALDQEGAWPALEQEGEWPALDREGVWPALDQEGVWPVALWRCVSACGPGGETLVCWAGGWARLLLSPSGEDFSVEFSCSLSQDQNHNHRGPVRGPGAEGSRPPRQTSSTASSPPPQTPAAGGTRAAEAGGTTKKLPDQPRPGSPHTDIRRCESQPAVPYQSTRVIQHHSCSCVPEVWSYPLSLALHRRALGQNRAPQDPGGETGAGRTPAEPGPCAGQRRRSCTLPEALPLRCPSPHQHRWKLKDNLSSGDQNSEQDLPTEMLRVMWCQGVVYRIVGGAIPAIEVSPGDGSVIRSNGALASYFTHHRAGPGTGPGTGEVTYHLSGLPPDRPGQTYSVTSVVTCASRILSCYNQARHSLKLHTSPSCLRQEVSFSESMSCEQEVHHNPESGHMKTAEAVQRGPTFVTAELEKIKRFNFLLENSSLPHVQMASPGLVQGLTEHRAPGGPPITQASVAEALQRTSRAIQDIDALFLA